MVPMSYIGQILKRNGFPYKIDSDGDLLTKIEGVVILIRPGRNNTSIVCSWVCEAQNPRAARSRAADVQAFVEELNRLFKYGDFLYNRDTAFVLFAVGVEMTGGSQDEAVLAAALVLSVDAARAFGLLIAGLLDGHISLGQARQVVYEALQRFDDNRHKRSA